MRNIIFDLDLTLVDSSIAEEARRRRDWPCVYSLISSFRLYDGMEEVFDSIREAGCKVAIVSTAPSKYVQRVVNYFSIPVNVIVGYHDAIRKPSPDGMVKAMSSMSASSSNIVSFGDRAIDIVASKAAGIISVGCLWGTQEKERLIASVPDLLATKPSDVIGILTRLP